MLCGVVATASNNTKENKKENAKYNTIKRSDNDNEDLSLSNKPPLPPEPFSINNGL